MADKSKDEGAEGAEGAEVISGVGLLEAGWKSEPRSLLR